MCDPLTFWKLVCRAAEEVPDRVILADDHGRTLTTTQFRAAAEKVAAALPVTAGDTVCWQLPTSLEAVTLMAALARLDVVQNPIIPALRLHEVGIITGQLQPDLFIAPETWSGFGFADMARGLGLRVLGLDFAPEPGHDLQLPSGDPSALPPPPANDTHWVYYSSGTTSDPKGVRHTDGTLIAAAAGLSEVATFGVGDVYPIAWPVTHIGGITMLTTSLQAGLKLVLFDRWDPTTTPARMAAHRPTILGSAQPFFRAYIAAQVQSSGPMFPDLRLVTAGGAPTPPEIVAELIDAFGVRGVTGSYGLTEFPIASATAPDDPEDVMLRSVGKASPGVQVRLVDGEIRLKGPQLFAGYVDESLGAAAFDEDGWFRSGDLGELDDDGYIFITGRLKDVIIRNAENISANEIEDVLLRHPDIVDVAVIGLPDSRRGELVCAVVVGRDGTTFDVAGLAAHCQASGLAKYKCPERVEVVQVLARNAMGKLLKQQLRDQLLQH